MSDSGFYAAFEELHRGPREMVESRLSVYLPFLEGVAQLHGDLQVTDLGCGRGEWLELVRKHGFRGLGVDLDDQMLASCRELGLDVHQGDALRFLAGLPDGSQSVVSAFHVAEHLPFDRLQALVRDAHRVLRPGGLLILETPNPENLAVGTSGFYMDPTHMRPLPPELLVFLPQFEGFGRAKILRLQQGPLLEDGKAAVTLLDVLVGVSPDYAVVAQKAVAGAARPQPLLDAAFAQDRGVTLHQLAQRHEQQWAGRVHDAHVEAANALKVSQDLLQSPALKAALVLPEQLARVEQGVDSRLAAFQEASAGQLREVEARLAALQEGTRQQLSAIDQKLGLHLAVLQNELAAKSQQLQAQSQQLDAMYASSSWRLTAPVRWVGTQVKALRAAGPREWTRRVARKTLGPIVRSGRRLLGRHPRAREAAVKIVSAAGVDPSTARAWMRFQAVPDQPAPGPADTASHETLTPSARRVHDALLRAIAARTPQRPDSDRSQD